MNTKVILLFLFLTVTINSIAQKSSYKCNNSVFLELGGAAAVYSLNYDRKIYFNHYSGVSLGLGFSPWLFDRDFSPRVPIHLNYFRQSKRHSFDVGLALTPYLWYEPRNTLNENLNDIEVTLFGQLSYKHLIIKDRFYTGVSFNPVLYDSDYVDIRFWGGLMFGVNF